MHCLLTLSSSLLLLISHTMPAVEAVDVYSIERDLAEFNKTCYQDKCEQYQVDSLSYQSCLCGIQCSQLDTCCLNSIYVNVPQPKVKPACRSTINGDFYFVVDQCPSDNIWSDLCNRDMYKDDEVQKLVPVTSLYTSITYKNYYCFRCHETSDDFLFWILKIESEFTHYETSEIAADHSDKNLSLTYNKDQKSWMAIFDEKVGYFPVNLSLQVPPNVDKLAHFCVPDVISDCSPEWSSDGEVREKCQSYMALREVERDGKKVIYRNIHCALCNFENLKDINCRSITVGAYGKIPFSFTFLLDINRSDGEIVDKEEECPDNHVWDRYAKMCRKLTCALPGFDIKNEKCVQD